MSTPPFQILPELAADDFNRLKASIRERGVEVPVVVDEDGEIIDGHNRAIIADSLGIEYPKIVRTGLSMHEKRLLAVELNLARRHLTDAQKALMGERIEPDIAAIAAANRTANLPTVTDQPSVTTVAVGRTTDEIAKVVGLGSGRTYERAKETIAAIREQAPELLPHVESGDLNLDGMRRELREREQATATRIFEVAGDPHGERARADLRFAFSKGRAVTWDKLLMLDPVQIAAVIDPDETDDIVSFIRKTRSWLDALEREMGQGIRLVARKDA